MYSQVYFHITPDHINHEPNTVKYAKTRNIQQMRNKIIPTQITVNKQQPQQPQTKIIKETSIKSISQLKFIIRYVTINNNMLLYKQGQIASTVYRYNLSTTNHQLNIATNGKETMYLLG